MFWQNSPAFFLVLPATPSGLSSQMYGLAWSSSQFAIGLLGYNSVFLSALACQT